MGNFLGDTVDMGKTLVVEIIAGRARGARSRLRLSGDIA